MCILYVELLSLTALVGPKHEEGLRKGFVVAYSTEYLFLIRSVYVDNFSGL